MRTKKIPLTRVTITIPTAVVERIKRVRQKFRFNASEICGHALAAEVAKLEKEMT